jgi:uncharacterized protein (DUF885 family)
MKTSSAKAVIRIVAVFLTVCVSWLPSTAASAQSDDAKLQTIFQAYLDRHFRQQPLEATRLGDHRFDAQLENLNPESRRQWEELARQTLADLPKQVDYDKLSRPAQIDYEMLEHGLKENLWLMKNLHPFEQDPRIYIGYINESIYLLLTQSSLPKETNVANCIARMAFIPRVIKAAKQNLKDAFRTHTETAIRQNRGAIAFYEKEIFDFAGDTKQIDALRAAARPVAEALKEYQHFLETEVLPHANGEWRLGKRKFAQKFELELDAGISADEAFEQAKIELARVEGEMYVIARQAWSHYSPGAVLPPDDPEGRNRTVRQVLEAISKEHCRPEELTAEMKKRVASLKQFISQNHILKLPEPDHCQVIEMPEFKRGNSTAYMEAPAPLDTNGVGQLAVSPPPSDWDEKRKNSFLEEYNDHMLDVLAIHEGYPGHSVQLEYMNQNPLLIRKVLQSGVYIEGWAVYTEQMMLDQGYGGGDLALRLSQLKFYLRAVANTILDHNMHCEKLTDDEAMDFLVGHCFQSEGEARLKVIRSKQSACQLSTYFVGRMAHYHLRQAIERELGGKFTLEKYHQAVLAPGAVPVKYLPELVRAKLEQ